MPITYGSYKKLVRLLPLTLNADGSAVVSVRWGFQNGGGEWSPFSEQQFAIAPDDVGTILDAQPRKGLSRRDDLALAVYEHLVQKGLIEAGEIS
jgi:hypothetical protein